MCAGFEMTGGEGTPTLGRGGLGEVCSVPGADHKGLRQDTVDSAETFAEGVKETGPIHRRVGQPSSLPGAW